MTLYVGIIAGIWARGSPLGYAQRPAMPALALYIYVVSVSLWLLGSLVVVFEVKNAWNTEF